MLETPNEKINNLSVKFVKENFPEIEENMMMQEALDKFATSLYNSYKQAVNKFIKQFAEEHNLSLRCAEYYIGKHFNLTVEVEEPEGIREIPKIVLVPILKSPEQLLMEINISTQYEEELWINDCEKELLEKTSIFKKIDQ